MDPDFEDDDSVVLPTEDMGALDKDAAAFEKQRINLQTYLDSVPYDCESVEEMQLKLEGIVGRIAICAQARNFLVLTTWDGMVQCWMLMKYPMAKSTRAKLVSLYYELCLLPGVEPRVVRSWADMIVRLLAKSGTKHKLDAEDLQLSWKKLWRVLQKELWPKKRLRNDLRNLVNVYLYVAEQCRTYYSASEIPEMLDTFFPLVTQESILAVLPVITSFLPPTHTELYLPALFKLWEAFNSSIIDDRMIELVGDVTEARLSDPVEDGAAQWKDVGIWRQDEWTFLVSKSLVSMNIPVGSSRASTAAHADIMLAGNSLKIKKSVNRQSAIAKLLVYSIFVDGAVRSKTPPTTRTQQLPEQETGYPAGSKALDSLERMIVSTETYFHPSNSGPWTIALTTFLQRLTAEFAKRWKEEEEKTCETPMSRRLTPGIRREFIAILRTPALLAMFSKDPVSSAFAQSGLRIMALLEPSMVMPELLERAYSGLEVVNETHRTTAVLSLLSGIALPLVSEKVWFGGQKHVVPLLELSLPGIDLNDPLKTIVTCMFIVSTVQHIRIGDLSMHQSALTSDDPGEMMDVDGGDVFPSGVEPGETPTLSREEERILVRDSTAGFADWVAALFRRIFALYENLPDEGGKNQTTGNKQEQTVIKSLKSVLDIVCLHLSDELFDLVLNITFNYATTNARANSVRTFGSLVASLARARPAITIAKFLPVSISAIREELANGASSVRTTSSHTAAAPSDTTIWASYEAYLDMAVQQLVASLDLDDNLLTPNFFEQLLKHKAEILDIVKLLVASTKTERSFSGTGRLVNRILHTLTHVYPSHPRFVNTQEWESPEFAKDHVSQWGRMYQVQECEIEWHTPSTQEIMFAEEILDTIILPCLDTLDTLLDTSQDWDNISRNDFCRDISIARAAWSGMPTIFKEAPKQVESPCFNESTESEALLVNHLDVAAGFALTDPSDPRYQRVVQHRERFGTVLHRAASLLRAESQREDHIDAVIAVTKGIDIYLLEYGCSRATFDSLQKAYTQSRDMNRIHRKQKESPRHVIFKRAQAYSAGRAYMHSLYRRRSGLDDKLISELVESSLSPYTRVRRHAQAVFHNVSGHYVRTGRFALPALFKALKKGSEADRIKGALHTIGNKGLASYALADPTFQGSYLMSLLEIEEEKPTIQGLASALALDCLVNLTEEAVHTDSYTLPTPAISEAIQDLHSEFSPNFIDPRLLAEATKKSEVRGQLKHSNNVQMIASILAIATKASTHWKYQQMASRFLHSLLRRDLLVTVELAQFFMQSTLSPHLNMRSNAQRAIQKITIFHKIRTYATSAEELWREEWKSPSSTIVTTTADPGSSLSTHLENLAKKPEYVDKIQTGFIVFTSHLKGYSLSDEHISLSSAPSLQAIREIMLRSGYFTQLLNLWAQESVRGGAVDLRSENVSFIKSLAKSFENDFEDLMAALDPLLSDSDKYKQRAGAEGLAGLLRGLKHWSTSSADKVWDWLMGPRLQRVFSQIKPDTLGLWEGVFSVVLQERDPSRPGIKSLVEWILALPLDFDGDSAFQMSKSLAIFGTLVDAIGIRFQADKYIDLFFDNANTSYAEIRGHIAQNIYTIARIQWAPLYNSTAMFLQACVDVEDPLRMREAPYMRRILRMLEQFPKWKLERLPPPRVSQSQYDMTGLTLLQWIWITAHGPQARLMFPYIGVMMPEIIRMSELNDSSELQTYSSAILYVTSAVSPPSQYVDIILGHFVHAIKSSESWRVRLHALPALVVFFYRNLLAISAASSKEVMSVLLICLADENVEVREMAAKVLSGVVRSQRSSIIPLKNRFVALAKKTTLPLRRDPAYADSLRALHSAILGLSALCTSFPYSVQPWMPSVIEVLARHAADPTPISTTIRTCASEFKKTHQDTWHTDQHAFNEEQLQDLSSILVGTSYYA